MQQKYKNESEKATKKGMKCIIYLFYAKNTNKTHQCDNIF